MRAVISCSAEARKKSSRIEACRPVSVTTQLATATRSSSWVLPKRPIQSSTFKPVEESRGSRMNTSCPALRRCSTTIGATSLDGSKATRPPPHLSAVGTVTDVVLNPPEPAKMSPWLEPNEPSKHSRGLFPPAPHVCTSSLRNPRSATEPLSTR